MLDNYFGNLFTKHRHAGLEEEIREMMLCKDPDKLREDYTDLIDEINEELNKMSDRNWDQDDPMIDTCHKALDHIKFYTDNGPLADAIDKWIDGRIYGCIELNTTDTRAEEERYRPQDHNKELPKSGGWIMIIRDIPVSKENKPFMYSVYYAKPNPVYTEVEFPATYKRKERVVRVPYYKVSIMTEAGTVDVWANEYMRIPDINAVLEEIGNSFTVERLGGTPNYDEAKVHYLKTRGVDQAGVYRLLMNSLNSISHIYYKIIPGEPYEFWEFYIDALQKGVMPAMALRIWHCKQTGQPLFKIVDKTKKDMVDKVMEPGPDGESISQKQEQLTVKQEKSGHKTHIRKSRKNRDPKKD